MSSLWLFVFNDRDAFTFCQSVSGGLGELSATDAEMY